MFSFLLSLNVSVRSPNLSVCAGENALNDGVYFGSDSSPFSQPNSRSSTFSPGSVSMAAPS